MYKKIDFALSVIGSVILMVLFFTFVISVSSALALQTEPPTPELPNVVQAVELALASFIGLKFWGVLVSVILTALQFKGWISQTGAEKLNFWLNVGLFSVIFILTLLGKTDLVSKLDPLFGNLSQFLTYLFILLGIPLGFMEGQKTHAETLSYSVIARSNIR